MIIDRMAKFFTKPVEDVDVDQRIPANIKAFKKTVPGKKIKKYKRPADWEKRIEIVTPCYNHAEYLWSSFNSVAWQTRKEPVRITYINDTSTDNSLEVLRDIKKSNPHKWIKVRIINNKKNINQGASLNKAIASSPAALIVVLDSDDMLAPDCLELIVATYKKNPDIAMLGAQSIWFQDEKKIPKHTIKPVSKLKLAKYGPKDTDSFTGLNSIQLSHSSLSYFKDAWELAGGYFEKPDRVCSFNDRDLQMRICSLLPIGIYPTYPMLFYRTVSSKGRGTV